jgi:DNA processing protein
MGTSSGEKLILAAAATARGIQMREQRDLAARGWDALESYYNALDPAAQAASRELADKLVRDGVSVVISCDNEYPKRLLDLRQPPTQPWAASAAMTRNAVIAALSQAMLVVEAGEKGGTLNAGLQAIDMGRAVYAIAYSDDPQPPNEVLFQRGAVPLRSSGELLSTLDGLASIEEPKQLAIGE